LSKNVGHFIGHFTGCVIWGTCGLHQVTPSEQGVPQITTRKETLMFGDVYQAESAVEGDPDAHRVYSISTGREPAINLYQGKGPWWSILQGSIIDHLTGRISHPVPIVYYKRT